MKCYYGFSCRKIEPSLGGMLRVIHAMKKGKNKFEISPRLKSYFRDRLELESYHIDYIMKKSEKIVRIINEIFFPLIFFYIMSLCSTYNCQHKWIYSG